MDTDELTTVYYTKHTGKIHLDKNCSYLKQGTKLVEKDASVLPEWKLDICYWCENYYNNWIDGVKTDKPQCQRCGQKLEIDSEYCRDCWDRIERKQARR